LVQVLVSPVHQNGSAADQVASVAAHLDRMRLAMALDLPLLLLIPAILFIGVVAGAESSKLARTGTALTFAVFLGAGYLLAGDVVLYVAAQQRGGAAFVERWLGNGVVNGVVLAYLLGHVAGFLLLGIALFRNRAVPRPAALSLCLWPFVEMGGTAAGLSLVAAAGDALLVVGCAACFGVLLRAARTTSTATLVGVENHAVV
jgi:hypothetical protein